MIKLGAQFESDVILNRSQTALPTQLTLCWFESDVILNRSQTLCHLAQREASLRVM